MLKINRKSLNILSATALSFCFAGLVASSASAASFWSITSNGHGQARAGCAATTTAWGFSSCKADAVSGSLGSGRGSIGIVTFGTKRPEKVSNTKGFAQANDTEAAAACHSFTLNAAKTHCDLGARSTSAAKKNVAPPKKQTFGLIWNW